MSNVNTLGSFGDTSGSSLMFRNRIINGGCLVAQRGSTALVNNTATYGGADRFLVAPFFTTSSGTIQKAAFSSATTGYGQFATITSTGTGNVVIAQRIESFNVLDLNGKTVTFSGIAYQNTGSAVTTTISIRKANGVDNFAGTTLVGSISTITLASGIETPFSLTLPLGGSDATNGLSVEVNFTGLGALTSKNFGVANVQLEAGSQATPFEQRPIGLELALCQRYFFPVFNSNNTYQHIGSASSGSNFFINIPYSVEMRRIPDMVATSCTSTITAGGSVVTSVSPDAFYPGLNRTGIRWARPSGTWTVGWAGHLDWSAGSIVASAEL